jgi:hypothetical protein
MNGDLFLGIPSNMKRQFPLREEWRKWLLVRSVFG